MIRVRKHMPFATLLTIAGLVAACSGGAANPTAAPTPAPAVTAGAAATTTGGGNRAPPRATAASDAPHRNQAAHGTTKPATWAVTAQILSSTEMTGTATTSFTFEDYGIQQPRVPVVLSVVNKITLELDFHLVKAN